MKTLGIDTSTEICGIAIIDGEKLIAEMNLNLYRAHSEKLIKAIKDVMAIMEMELSDLELISISSGPGSFTGLRIGMAAAKGLAFSLNIPLTSVVTLDALAFQAPAGNLPICPIIKARQDEIYAAVYRKNIPDKFERISDYYCIKVSEIETIAQNQLIMLGNGVSYFGTQIKEILGEQVRFAPPIDNFLRGHSIARLGHENYRKTQQDEIEILKPFYIQDFISGGKRRKK